MAAKPKLATSKTPNDLPQTIAKRAYEFYEMRGRENGHDLDDWLAAETEIVQAGLTSGRKS